MRIDTTKNIINTVRVLILMVLRRVGTGSSVAVHGVTMLGKAVFRVGIAAIPMAEVPTLDSV